MQLYEVIDDEQRDELYLVMEFIDGGDLQVCRTPLPAASHAAWRCAPPSRHPQDPINKKRFVDTDTLRHVMTPRPYALRHTLAAAADGANE